MNTKKIIMLILPLISCLSGCSSWGVFAKSHADCQSMFEYGEYYDYIDYCSKYAENDITTQWNLAVIYRTNAVGLENFKKTAYYTQLAASNGQPAAVSQICVDYKTGTGGVRKDYDRALWWCSKAASQGDINALKSLPPPAG